MKKKCIKVFILTLKDNVKELKRKVRNYFKKYKVVFLNDEFKRLNYINYEGFLFHCVKNCQYVITSDNYIKKDEITRENVYLKRFKREIIEEKDL